MTSTQDKSPSGELRCCEGSTKALVQDSVSVLSDYGYSDGQVAFACWTATEASVTFEMY